MLRIALDEWAEWGSVVVTPGQRPAYRPGRERPGEFPPRAGLLARRAADEGAIAQNRRLYAAALAGDPQGAALWQEPFWSAAFISYVLQAAGMDRREFPGTPRMPTMSTR